MPTRWPCRRRASSYASGRRSRASGSSRPRPAVARRRRRDEAGPIATDRVLLTGGPSLRAVGRPAGLRIPAGAARHTVAVLEPHEAFDVERMPMVFDIGEGLYWRLEEGGLLFGWSDPDESPGEARSINWPMYETARAAGRARPDHPRARAPQDLGRDDRLHAGPPADPRAGADAGRRRLEGVTVASAGGHGMMWGPGVARAAADLALTGPTDVLDVTDLGLDRFDEHGRSRLATDPIALPFPVEADEDEAPVSIG